MSRSFENYNVYNIFEQKPISMKDFLKMTLFLKYGGRGGIRPSVQVSSHGHLTTGLSLSPILP